MVVRMATLEQRIRAVIINRSAQARFLGAPFGACVASLTLNSDSYFTKINIETPNIVLQKHFPNLTS